MLINGLELCIIIIIFEIGGNIVIGDGFQNGGYLIVGSGGSSVWKFVQQSTTDQVRLSVGIFNPVIEPPKIR